jgi:UrcA family protein
MYYFDTCAAQPLADLTGTASWLKQFQGDFMIAIHHMHLRAVTLVAFASLLVAESAAAVTRYGEAPSITVRYQDLDLTRSENIGKLYERIRAAAVEVCKPAEVSRNLQLALLSEWNACIGHSVAKAVKQVHNEKLSAYQWQQIRGWKNHSSDTPINVARR